MPSFRDAVANYNKTKGPEAAVPLNPPEAKTVLVQQTTPEVEAPRPAPAAAAPSPPATSALPAPSAALATASAGAPAAETSPPAAAVEPPKRTRRTKAEMEAARAAASTPRDENERPGQTDSSDDGPTLLQRIVAMQLDLPEGVTLTIVGRG